MCDEHWATARGDGEDSAVEGRGCGDAPLDAKGPIFFYVSRAGCDWSHGGAFPSEMVYERVSR